MADTEKTNAPAIDGEFDEARAKRLVENLRAEVATLKTERDSWRTQAEEAESKGKSSSDAVTAAEERARTAERALWTEKALRRFPAVEGVADLLSGDDEDAVLTLAERLSKLTGPAKGDEEGETPSATPAQPGEAPSDEDDADKGSEGDSEPSGPGSRPAPDLTPGHTSGGGQEFDPDAVLAAVRARR